ncbi:MAG: hypothetical protein COS34_03845 [Lysobacterales bacterium CG02_land_8_20_14_3_00_62_12]|nr:MAG: hypothetical protein COS34_03845 [Xanthomonadales bacterium CG02_land_8_20_14_3_00_62_12]
MLNWQELAALGMCGLAVGTGWRLLRSKRRNRLLLQILDDADAIEARLQRCRQQMHGMGDLLGRLPADITAQARRSLDSDASIQQALKIVLRHRLWLRDHATSASLRALAEVARSIRQSLADLDNQIARLQQVSVELEAAYARSDAMMGIAGTVEPAANRSTQPR